jgi:hypothetical protein
MLIGVLLVVRPEMAPGLVRIGSMEGQGIEFVVAHDSQGGAGIHHRPNELEGLPNMRATVDEVAKKDGLAFWVPVDALVLGIAQLPEEPLEGVSVAVDVTDEVVHGDSYRPLGANKSPQLIDIHRRVAPVQHGVTVRAYGEKILNWIGLAAATASEHVLMVHVDKSLAEVAVAFAEVHPAA